MRQYYHRITVSLLLAATFLLAGCRTDTDLAHTGHAASLEISGRSEVDILRAMQTVFEAHGYQHVEDLIFEKKGSVWETVMYGGWNADGVWIRMKASVDPGPNGDYVLGCDAFRVTNHNQGLMEEEKDASRAYHTECQKILNEVQARLASGATGS